jgi:hypothetical protein
MLLPGCEKKSRRTLAEVPESAIFSATVALDCYPQYLTAILGQTKVKPN